MKEVSQTEEPASSPGRPRPTNDSMKPGETLLMQNFAEIPNIETRSPESAWIPSGAPIFAGPGDWTSGCAAPGFERAPQDTARPLQGAG